MLKDAEEIDCQKLILLLLMYISFFNHLLLFLPFDDVLSIQIRIAATNALLNSLEFSKQNFEREVRSIIMCNL